MNALINQAEQIRDCHFPHKIRQNSAKRGISESMARAKAAKKDSVKDSLKMPDGSIIDLSSFDWGGEKLTEKQKLFIVWFCTPGTEYYHCGMKAARKAGYTANTAHDAAYKMRRDPKIDKLIKKFDDAIGKYNILDAAQRWIQEKIIRGDYDVKDFYDIQSWTNEKTKQSGKTPVLKDLEELTAEQRLCIDRVDVVGQRGVMVYVFPDREKIRDSLIAYVQKKEAGQDDDGYDIETLTEIIKGDVKVKTRIINRNKEILGKAAGFMDIPKGLAEEE
jgi:phage terminase small subunit